MKERKEFYIINITFIIENSFSFEILDNVLI